MNILPFVFAFLLTFSCLTFSFVRERNSIQLIEFALQGYLHTEKATRNGVIKHAFDKIKGEELFCPVTKTKPSSFFVSKRSHFPPLETTKFYLRAFLKGPETSKHPLYEPLASLLRELYQETLFIPEKAPQGVEYLLVESMIQTLKTTPSVHHLSDLWPRESSLHTLYYHMLRGTNRYSKQEGIPPLHHFLSLDKSDKGFHVNLASEAVLKACVGSVVQQEILKQEQQQSESTQKQYSFSKQEFQKLSLLHPKEQMALEKIEPFISYAKRSGKKESLLRRDAKTKIGIEKEL